MDSNDSVIPSTSKMNIKSECNSDIGKEVLETKAFKDYLVGLGVCEPVDEKKKPFKCHFCLRGFTRRGNCKEHEEVCKRKRKLIAVPSQNLSNDLSDLDQQMDVDLTHKQKKKLLCEFCSREFKDNSNRRKHMKICKKSNQTTESKSFKDYLVGIGEIKSEVSEPSDEFSNSQKPSTSKVKIKSQEEILESKAFKEYVAEIGIVGKRKIEYSEPIQKVKGVEIFKYEKGKRDLTPIHQTTKSFKDYLAQEKGEQLDTEIQIQGENLESNILEDNFVGLCEIKSEFTETNDEFMENQAIQEIDPLELQTENKRALPSTSKPKVKSQKEILESKSFQDYVAGLIN